MFVLIGYDIPEKRTQTYHKLLGKYLEWQQNSLFSGNMLESDYKKMMHDISKISKTGDRIFALKQKTETM